LQRKNTLRITGTLQVDIRQLLDAPESTEAYAPGDVVFREGDTAHHMYVVLDGEMELQVEGRAVGSSHPGDLLGEMAIVGSHRRTATAIARTACRLAPVTERRFVLLVQEHPYFALHVMKVLTDRIVRKEHEKRAEAP
jgi:CRP-like cAMP-binding protein